MSSVLVGAPFMWPADTLPPYTLALDGSMLEVALYSQLYAVYRRIYTPPEIDHQYFCLPDYRGLLLRGVDMGSGQDPEAVRRVTNWPWSHSQGRADRGDGTVDDAVGTYQLDAYKYHYHWYPGSTSVANGDGLFRADLYGNGPESGYPHEHTGSAMPAEDFSSTETRCDNIAMTYITYYQ